MQLVEHLEIEGIEAGHEDHLLSEFQGFTQQSFQTLQRLADDPTRQNYRHLESDLHFYVKRPMEALFRGLAPSFELKHCGLIETRKRTLSNFCKNDFGRGGCYPYLWGAFYRKGLTRRRSPQLCIKIHSSQLLYGFAFGD